MKIFRKIFEACAFYSIQIWINKNQKQRVDFYANFLFPRKKKDKLKISIAWMCVCFTIFKTKAKKTHSHTHTREIEKDSERWWNVNLCVVAICFCSLSSLQCDTCRMYMTERKREKIERDWRRSERERERQRRALSGQNNKMKFNKIINWKIRPFFFFVLHCCCCCCPSEAIIFRWFPPRCSIEIMKYRKIYNKFWFPFSGEMDGWAWIVHVVPVLILLKDIITY